MSTAKPGSCPINCQKEFIMFLAVMCFLKFCGSTGRASNFLVSVRCVEERDKTVAMGFGLMFMALFSFIPSPIFFGTGKTAFLTSQNVYYSVFFTSNSFG